MKVENIMPETKKYYILYNSIYIKCSEHASLQRPSIVVVAKGWGDKDNGTGKCYTDCTESYATLGICENNCMLYVKSMNCIVRKLYLKKAVKIHLL